MAATSIFCLKRICAFFWQIFLIPKFIFCSLSHSVEATTTALKEVAERLEESSFSTSPTKEHLQSSVRSGRPKPTNVVPPTEIYAQVDFAARNPSAINQAVNQAVRQSPSRPNKSLSPTSTPKKRDENRNEISKVNPVFEESPPSPEPPLPPPPPSMLAADPPPTFPAPAPPPVPPPNCGPPTGGVALPGLVGSFSSFLNQMAAKREKELEMEIYGAKVLPSIGTHF